MNMFQDLPIKRKVTSIILIACAVPLILAAVSLYQFFKIQSERSIRRDLKAQAEIIAANSRAALAFEDSQAAEETLSALKAKPHILRASIRLPDGGLFADYGNKGLSSAFPKGPSPAGFYFSDSHLILYEPILHLGQPKAVLALYFDYRALMHENTRPFAIIVGLVLAASLTLSLGLSFFLRQFITRPLLGMAATARAVAEAKDYSVRADCQSRDEFGLFAQAFNQMLDRIQSDDKALRLVNQDLAQEVSRRKAAQAELEKLHKQMLGISHQAGMAEVATNVLHNVGNVLNSVNVSSNLILDQLRQSKVGGLAKVAQMMQVHSEDLANYLASDAKAKKIPSYLASLGQVLLEERDFIIRETQSLRNHIDHIKEIVSMQQSYSKVLGMVETVALEDLVEDALKLNAGALERHSVQVRREFGELPRISVEKNKVLQILVNLIRNAKYACDEGGQSEKWIALKTVLGENGCAQIQVVDNGIGIAPENLTRIFAHGFTTRAKGHGYGLHSGALAAKELGGQLTAYSAGLGQGAQFILELPFSRGKEESAPPGNSRGGLLEEHPIAAPPLATWQRVML